MQLWALGRAADPDVLTEEGGFPVVSSGNIKLSEGKATPQPLTIEEIKEYIGYYATAATNAIKAGFDGVEIHGANGTPHFLSRGASYSNHQNQATSSTSSSKVSLTIGPTNMEAQLKIGLDLPSRSSTLSPRPSVRIGLQFDSAPGVCSRVGLTLLS
jgi:hypothetical protein